MSAWAKGLRSGTSEEENALKRRSYALAQESSVLRDHLPSNRRGRSEAAARPHSLHNVASGHPPLHGPLSQIAENSTVRSLSKSPGRKPSQRGVSPSRIPKAQRGRNSSGDDHLNLSSSPSSFETNESFYSQTNLTNQPSLHGQNFPDGQPHSWHGQNFSQGHPLVNPSAQSPPKKIVRGKSPTRIPKSTIESFQNALKSVLGSRSQTDNASSASSVVADSAHRRPLTRGTSPSRIPSSNQRRESQASYDLLPQTFGVSPTSNPTSRSAIDLPTSEGQSWSSNASFRRGTSPSRIPRSNSKRDLNKRESPPSPIKKSPRGTSPSRIPRSNSKRDLTNHESSSMSPNDRTLVRGTSPSRIPRSNSQRDLASRGSSSASPSDRTIIRGTSPSRIPRSNSKRDLARHGISSTSPSDRILTRGTSPSRIPRSNSKRDLASHGNLSTSPRDLTLARGTSPSRIPRSNSKRDLVSRENPSTSPSDRTLNRGISPSRIPRSNSNRDLRTRASPPESPNKSSVPRGVSPSRIPRSNSKRDLLSQGRSSSSTKTDFHSGASPSTDHLSGRNVDDEYLRTFTPTTDTRPVPRGTSPSRIPTSTLRQQSDSPNVSPSRSSERRGRNVQARGMTPTSKNRNEASNPESNFQRQRSLKNSSGPSPGQVPDKKREKNEPRQLSGPNNNMNAGVPRSAERGANNNPFARANSHQNRPRSQYDPLANSYAISGSQDQRSFQETHLDDLQHEPRKKKTVRIGYHNNPRDLNKQRDFTKSENNMYVSSSGSESESSLGIIDLHSDSSISLIDLTPRANAFLYPNQEVDNTSHVHSLSHHAIGKERIPNQHGDIDRNGNPFNSRIVSPTSFRPLVNTNLAVYQSNDNRPSNVINNDPNYQQHASRKRRRKVHSQNENTGPAKAPRATLSSRREFVRNMIPNHPNKNSMSRSMENLDDGSSVTVSLNTASSRRSSLYSISPVISMGSGSLSPIMHSRRIIEYDRPNAEAVNDYPPLYTPPPPPSHSNSTFSPPDRKTSLFSGNAIHPQQTPRQLSREIIGSYPVVPERGPSVDTVTSVEGASNNWQSSYPDARDNKYHEQREGGPQSSPYTGGKPTPGYDVTKYPPQQSISGQTQKYSGPHSEIISPERVVSSAGPNNSGFGSTSPQHQPVPLPRQRLSSGHEQIQNQSQLQHSDPHNYQQLQQQPEHQYQQQYSEPADFHQLPQQEQQQKQEHQIQQQYSEPPNPQQLQQEKEHQYQHQLSVPADLHQLEHHQEHQLKHQFSVPADLQQLEPPQLSNHQPLLNKNLPRPQQFLSVPKNSNSNRPQKKRTPADSAQEATSAAAPQQDTPQHSTKGSRWFGRGRRPTQLDVLSAKRGVDPLTQSSPSSSNTTNIGKRGSDDNSIGKANDSASIKGQALHSTTPTGDPRNATAVAELQQSGAGVAAGLTDSPLSLPNAHISGQQSSVGVSGAPTAPDKPGNVGLLASLFNRKLNGRNQRYPEGGGTASVTGGVKNADLKNSRSDKENTLLISASDKVGTDGIGGVVDLKVYGHEGKGESIVRFPLLQKELGIPILNASKEAVEDNLESHNLLETLKYRESDQCRDLGIENTAFENITLENGQLIGKNAVKPTQINNIPNAIPPQKVTTNKHPVHISANDTRSDVRGPGNLNLADQSLGKGPSSINPHNTHHQPQGLLGIDTRSAFDIEHQPSTQLRPNAQEPVDLLGGTHEIVENWLQDSLSTQNSPVNVSAAAEPTSGHTNVDNVVVSASNQGYQSSGGLGRQATNIDALAYKGHQESDLRRGMQSINADRVRVGGMMGDNMLNGAFEMGVPSDAIRDGTTNHTEGLVNNSYEVDITNSSLEDSQPPNAQKNRSGKGNGRKKDERGSPDKIAIENGRPPEQTKTANEPARPVDIMQMRLNCLQDKSSNDQNRKSKNQQNKNPKAAPKRPLVQKSMLQEKAKAKTKPSKQKNGVKAVSATPSEDRRSSKDSASSLVKKRGFFRRGRSNSRSSHEGDDYEESAITIVSEAQGPKRGFFRRGRSNSRSSHEGDDYAESAITIGSEAQGHPLAGVETRTYWTRFYILGLFSIIAMMECVIWGTWGPIMESARYAFPSWTSGSISLFNSWGPIVCILFIVPMAWLNQRFGLRMGIVLCTSLMAAGTLVRCIPADETTFTVLANVGAFTNALSGCLTLSLPAMIAATWFPPNERTTATAVAGLFSQMGSAVMYLEPFVVRVPPYTGYEECSSDSRNYINSQREERALGTRNDSSDRTRYIRSLLIPEMDGQEGKLQSFLYIPLIDNQQLPWMKLRPSKNIERVYRKMKRSSQRAPNPSYPDQEDQWDPNRRFDLSNPSHPSSLSDPMDPDTFFGGHKTSSESPNRQNGSPYDNRFSNPSDQRNPDRLHGSRSEDQLYNPSYQRDPSDSTRPTGSTPSYRNQDSLYDSTNGNQSSNRTDQRDPSDTTRSVDSSSTNRNQDRSDDSPLRDQSFNSQNRDNGGVNSRFRFRASSSSDTSGSRDPYGHDQSSTLIPKYNSASEQNYTDNERYQNPTGMDDDDGTVNYTAIVDSSGQNAGGRYRSSFIGQAQRDTTPESRSSLSDGNGQSERDRYANYPPRDGNDYRPGYNNGDRNYEGDNGDRRYQGNNRDKNNQGTQDGLYPGRNNQDGSAGDRNAQNFSAGAINSERNLDGTRNYSGNSGDDRSNQGNGVGDRDGGGPRTKPEYDGGRRTYPGADDGPRPSADDENSRTDSPYDRSSLRGREPGSELTPEDVYGDIMILMYIHAGIAVFLLILSIGYFPARPKLPPSQSSAMERHDYFASIKIMFCNRQLMLLVLTYVFSVGIPIVWVAVMNFSLCCIGIRQEQAMYVAITAVLLSCCTAFIAARVTDVLYGHLKITCVVLLLGASTCFLWFLLLSMGVIAPDLVQVYLSVAGGIALQYATVPLLIELAVELAYPCPESVVGAFLTWTFNIVSGTFLLLFLIPSSCYTWVNIVLVACTSVTVIPLAFVKETHRRRAADDSSREGGASNRPVVVPKFVVEYAESVQRQRAASGEQLDEYQDTFPPATLPGTPSSVRSVLEDKQETNI